MRVDSLNNGRPDKPPPCAALSRAPSEPGREIVVLETIDAVDAMLAGNTDRVVEIGERQIGRDLDQNRRRPGARPHPFARVDDAAKQFIERLGLLQIAQTGRIGRGDVDGEIAGDGGESLDQPDIVLGAVGQIAVGADIDADNAALVGTRAASRAKAAAAPPLLNPSRLITPPSASSRKTRGLGLPTRGRGVIVPISTKPKPSRSSASGATASLSKPAARPIGLGKLSLKARTRSSGGSGSGLVRGSNRSAFNASPCASSGSRARKRVAKGDQKYRSPQTAPGLSRSLADDPIGRLA